MSERKLEENKAQKDLAVETISTKHKTAKIIDCMLIRMHTECFKIRF